MSDFGPFYRALADLHKGRRRKSEQAFDAMWDIGFDLIDAMQKESLSPSGEVAIKDALVKMREIIE